MLGSGNDHDFSGRGWQRRREIFGGRRIVFVAPSRWMAETARRSSLLAHADIRVIANGVDTRSFAPQDRRHVRAALGIAPEVFVAIAGAAHFRENPRKGFAQLRAALRAFRELNPDGELELVLFGDAAPRLSELEGFRVHDLGVLKGDAALALAYAAADVFVLPSLEDNLPNTAIEAMAAAIPVVACAAGGAAEIVGHEQQGLLVERGRVDALARAIARLQDVPEFRMACGVRAREKVLREFSDDVAAARHIALYRELAGPR
jgi:glycosyltransferase involved in cell wall biosynthesis